MSTEDEFDDMNRMLDILQHIDLGLVVIDQHFDIDIWNGFMVHHTGKMASDVKGQSLFDVFPEIEEMWLREKLHSAFNHKQAVFSVWQDRPYLFKSRNVLPLTGNKKPMFQNVTFRPLVNMRGIVTHVGIMVTNVTTEALLYSRVKGNA
ncbi:PAS domain-containing protein [Veronia pacifica]|uniref:Diguanylate cyclase n=1 Tax=Veronia pacifica TaxID=1080227 RepID=A0A1C3EG88_9GAMM|nr:PAS domain-containing protein [Veronia pacifica]ODA32224.1 diguanylate cyclase [Veronia pacifica]